MNFAEFMKRINAEKNLFLVELHEDESDENCLVVTASSSCERAVCEEDTEGWSEDISRLIMSSRVLEADKTTLYKLRFEQCIAYTVSNESYFDDYIKTEGESGYSQKLRVYECSAFLDYVKQTTFAEQIHGKYKHYRILCCNQIIDAAAFNEPYVEILINT